MLFLGSFILSVEIGMKCLNWLFIYSIFLVDFIMFVKVLIELRWGFFFDDVLESW